jgi:hypothetical protein
LRHNRPIEPKLRHIVDTSETESPQTLSHQWHNARNRAGALHALLGVDGRFKSLSKEDTMPQTAFVERASQQKADKNAIRPFQVDVPEDQLTELRRRIKATIWPERETVPDATQP